MKRFETKKLISQGLITEAFDILSEHIPPSLKSRFILLMARWHRLEDHALSGLISERAHSLEYNRVVENLLKIVDLTFSLEEMTNFERISNDNILSESIRSKYRKPQIFISYHSSLDRKGTFMDELQKVLKEEGFTILSSEETSDRSQVTQFISRIEQEDLIILLLDQAYFMSEYTMREISEIASSSGFGKSIFTNRVLPVLLDRSDLRSSDTLMAYKEYWRKKYYDTKSRKLRNIHRDLDDIFDWIANIYERIPKTDLQPIKERIEEQLRAA